MNRKAVISTFYNLFRQLYPGNCQNVTCLLTDFFRELYVVMICKTINGDSNGIIDIYQKQ